MKTAYLFFLAVLSPVAAALSIACALLTVAVTIAMANGIDCGGFSVFALPLPFGVVASIAFGAVAVSSHEEHEQETTYSGRRIR